MEQARAELAAEDTETRQRGVRRLGVTDGSEAIALLIRLLDDPDIEVAGRAVMTLGQREAPEALPVLLDRLHSHPSGDVRAGCALALESYDGECLLEPLLVALRDPDEDVVRTVIFVLGSRDDPSAAEGLFPLLQDSRWNVRYGACQALVGLEVRDPRLSTALECLLRSPGQLERFQSLDWVEQALKAAEQEPVEEETSEEPDPAVLAHAERLLREGDATERKKAAQEFQRFESLPGSPSALEALTVALDDPEPAVRATAALTLGRQAVPAALPGLIQHLLHDEVTHVRRMCAAFLHYYPASEAVDPLIRALGDTDWGIRLSACVGLGLLGDARAIPALFPLLEDPTWNNRVNAAWALVKLEASDPRLLAALEQFARDPEAVEWDLQADEMNQMELLAEDGEDEVTPSLKIHELLAEARRLASRDSEDEPS